MPQTPLAPWPVIAQPMRDAPIETLQHLLHHHGSSITADGIFGPKTDAALKAFQQSHGLVVDGKAGPQTWPKLADRGHRRGWINADHVEPLFGQ